MPSLDALRAHIVSLDRVLLGYSGGVDSALLAVVATEALGRDRFLAVIGRSASYPASQYDTALDVAARFGIPVFEVATRELDDDRYLANPVDRCYFCKSELWSRLGAVAAERNFAAVIDGTNADDLGEHRPGLRAAGERNVGSPLAELGWTKADVRAASRDLGLPTFAAPAAPCLSSRVRYGLRITAERLGQVEQGEAYLRRLGVQGDLRVRHLGDRARIEVSPMELPALRARWHDVAEFFAGLGFGAAELDPLGYRRGSLLVLEAPPG